ncbi:hypothetical protein Pcinc_017590 [Petrolisthes cinctipes]|uniref:Uncharacterized protein n=1 Tax=Petrolisthes cinctipes TaxID=88211 RepID=A0AAE1FNX1_PETCI|nr:hypothetical protein Pcinc_017590 [Petrolisthes cinctipes]
MVVECDRGGGVGGGGGGGGGDMGWGRVVVGCVLSVISLTVLSLHVALCVHYPSPLFAVTLLLNPSLWMVVGGAGVGVAMGCHVPGEAEEGAGLPSCTCCHTRYGATTDPAKCTTATTNGAVPHRPPRDPPARCTPTTAPPTRCSPLTAPSVMTITGVTATTPLRYTTTTHIIIIIPRTRPPGHVPVHLFAATASSSTRPAPRDTPHDSDGGNDSGTAASNSPPPPRPASPLLDPDVASLSSECGLLAGEEGDESQTGRDLAMSPLLGAQKAGGKGHQQDQDSPPLDTHQGESVKSRPLSSLLAGTRRVLGRPRWPRTPQTRQDHQRTSSHHHNSRSPSRELLASPRKRRAPGTVWGMGVWRQQQQQQQTPAQHHDKDSDAPTPCQATTPPGGVLESVRPRDTWQRRQRHGKVRQRPASDSVLLLSDDATEE